MQSVPGIKFKGPEKAVDFRTKTSIVKWNRLTKATNLNRKFDRNLLTCSLKQQKWTKLELGLQNGTFQECEYIKLEKRKTQL